MKPNSIVALGCAWIILLSCPIRAELTVDVTLGVESKASGSNGGATSPIAYISVTPGNGPKDVHYALIVANADGSNPQPIIASPEPIMSPAWSPDGKKIAYVSFEHKKPAIFIQTLATRERLKVSELPGVNGAPAWSPDGTQLALTLSKDGNPEIYVMDLNNRSLRRVTDHFGIDTEPAWSPYGQAIVFTSDRGGKPQLYSVPATGGQPQRLTFEGDYNARAAFSPDGKYLAMVHGNENNFRIAVLNLTNKNLRVLTTGNLDESPSFAPNGGMILYATQAGGKSGLAVVALDGSAPKRLPTEGAEAREPAWSPK